MDLTPLLPAGRQIIERYGPSGFRVAGVIWRCPVLVFPDLTLPWTIAAAAAVNPQSLQAVLDHGAVEILLLGLGIQAGRVTDVLSTAMRQAGIVLEPMDTGAACRTYNVLLGEDRRVAAALLPPT